MTRRSPEREQFLFDLMVTACEGGIGYWCFMMDYNIWLPHRPGEELQENHHAQLQIYDFIGAQADDPDTTQDDWKQIAEKAPEHLLPQHLHDLNADVMARGLRRAWAVNWNNPRLRNADRTNGRNGDFDSNDADCIVQFGTLGDVQYG